MTRKPENMLDVQIKNCGQESSALQRAKMIIVFIIQIIGSVLAVSVFLSVIYLTLLLIATDPLNKPVVDSGYPFRTNEELNQAKKYHGVNALQIENNEWVFYRDGYACRAFGKEKP